ncbi:MAG: hypothetical protein JWN57_1711 [Frankiales bacterium]|jgi:hypothetical protein|nr:hypothetical protein [Frankiales bacterium]
MTEPAHPAATTTDPTAVLRGGAPAEPPARADLPRRFTPRASATGNKPTYLATEFLVFVALVVGVLLAAAIVQNTNDEGDYFRADRAWWYITLLGMAYMISRGLAKAGRQDRDG